MSRSVEHPHDGTSIEERIRKMVDERGAGKTVCPSEVAAMLAERGEIAVTQKGRTVDAREARGPIRLGRRIP